MKEDYLWDKTGENDAEIEKLENALQAFRFKETTLPALPASNVIPFNKKSSSRKSFRFVLAAAACLMFGLLATGIWLQFINDKTDTQNTLAGGSNKQTEVPVSNPSVDDKTDTPVVPPSPARKQKNLPVKKVEKPKAPTERKDIKIPQVIPPKVRRDEAMANNIKKGKSGTVQLTEEEQYAYDQLMLALSITSSKLKIVKDKAVGADE